MTDVPFDARWDEVERELDALLDASPEARSAHLAALADRDAELYVAVQRALAAAESDHELLDRAAVEVVSGSITYGAGEGEFDAGTRLGAYRLQRRLGAGGMGEVWLADRADEKLRQTVAVKLLRPIAASPEGLRRFTAERQILATLRHPNIAQVIDADRTAAGLPFLVLEYVDGRVVTDFCRDRHLDLEQRLMLFDQILEAVAFAHRHLVIHRDLKPSNILVTEDGRVKLLDFGIAKLLDPTAIEIDAAPLTRTGLRLMTPEYAAPEQLRGEGVSTATDVWALGVLLYELLTGTRPFDLAGLSPIEIERMVCDMSPRRP